MLISQLPAPLRQPLIEAETNAIIGPLVFEGRIYILRKDGFREYGLSDPKAASLTLVRAILPLLADASREERKAATKQISAQTAVLQTCDEMANLNENLASGALPYLKNLQIGSLSPQLQKIVTPLQIGEKTNPLPFAEGMTVFMVCERNQPKIELPDIETLKQAEFEKLMTNISGRYLLRLQRKAVIDYRS
jgi:peptidyl-prolyl cis-trans isomerase SurA